MRRVLLLLLRLLWKVCCLCEGYAVTAKQFLSCNCCAEAAMLLGLLNCGAEAAVLLLLSQLCRCCQGYYVAATLLLSLLCCGC